MKLKDTKAWKFLKEKAPVVADKIMDVVANKTGIDMLKDVIKLDPDMPALTSDEKKELNKLILDHELELLKIQSADRADARAREIEYVKAGKRDYMFMATGIVGLGSFVLLICSLIFWPDKYTENPLFHQLMGMIEGVALSIFMYYFGSSKGSKDKTEMMNKKS